jgi:hypothetical protein
MASPLSQQKKLVREDTAVLTRQLVQQKKLLTNPNMFKSLPDGGQRLTQSVAAIETELARRRADAIDTELSEATSKLSLQPSAGPPVRSWPYKKGTERSPVGAVKVIKCSEGTRIREAHDHVRAEFKMNRLLGTDIAGDRVTAPRVPANEDSSDDDVDGDDIDDEQGRDDQERLERDAEEDPDFKVEPGAMMLQQEFQRDGSEAEDE